MLQSQVNFICQEFALGQPLSAPQVLHGGLIHEMWHIRTAIGEFAIKRVNQTNTQLLSKTILPIHHAESLAQHYQQCGLLARAARKSSSVSWSIFCDLGQQWMVFPWVTGRTKTNLEITVHEVKQIGKLLNDLHTHSSTIENLSLPTWFGFPDDHWQLLIQNAQSKNVSWAGLAQSKKSVLQFWSEQANNAQAYFKQDLIISHRDISMTNIIWNEDNAPVLIDWEYAGLTNPAVEIYLTAMTWSLVAPGQINEANFNALVRAAGHDFQLDHPRLLAHYAGYLLEWCEFNMQRSLMDENSREISSGEVTNVISILAWLEDIRGDRN